MLRQARKKSAGFATALKCSDQRVSLMSATGAQQALIGRPRLVRRPYREPRIKPTDLRAQFIALTVPRTFDGVRAPLRQAVAPQAAY